MLRRAWCVAVILPACFNPNYAGERCSPLDECPGGFTCNPVNRICETGDARLCYGTEPFTICLAAAPSKALMIETATTLDTDLPATLNPETSQGCTVTTSGDAGYCVVAATTITVGATLRAIGVKSLVLVASDSITVTGAGVIDVGSHQDVDPHIRAGAGADPAMCSAGMFAGMSPTHVNSSGGGAGGSFLGLGGSGGTGGGLTGGGGGVSGATVASVTTIRGGCPGQEGAGADPGASGDGGGAVFLIAGRQIDVSGSILAGGAGGGGGSMSTSSGGGGGGAGGMIGFDAPAISGTGLLVANGGGGGEGGGSNASASTGRAGADSITTTAARGGSGNTMTAGDGGDGSSGSAAGAGAEASGGGSNSGGGGGGGGAGIIMAPASAILGSQVSPVPTP